MSSPSLSFLKPTKDDINMAKWKAKKGTSRKNWPIRLKIVYRIFKDLLRLVASETVNNSLNEPRFFQNK
jgi:hypothetical protein